MTVPAGTTIPSSARAEPHGSRENHAARALARKIPPEIPCFPLSSGRRPFPAALIPGRFPKDVNVQPVFLPDSLLQFFIMLPQG